MNSNYAIYAYIGTYTDEGNSEGIYIYRMDDSTGELEYVGTAEAGTNPTYLAMDPEQRYLYAVNTIEGEGMVSAFSMDPRTGQLSYLNRQSSGGSKPVQLAVDGTGNYVLAANFGSGSICVLPIREDGSLGESTEFIQHEGSSIHPVRQTGPRVHSIMPANDGRFAIAAEYGADKLMSYQLDTVNGELIPGVTPWTAVEAGSGPRHFIFHPSGRWAYVINELGNTLMSYDYDSSNGSLVLKETLSTLPSDYSGRNSCADVQVDATGRFVYGSNRGHDSIVIYAVNQDTGELQCIGHEPTLGKSPRSFCIDPTGSYLLAAHQETNNIVVFRIDRESGKLQPTGHQVTVPVSVCVKMAAFRM